MESELVRPQLKRRSNKRRSRNNGMQSRKETHKSERLFASCDIADGKGESGGRK